MSAAPGTHGDPTVFISYRRADSAGWAHSLHRALVDVFGPDQVFRDIDNIALGERFPSLLDKTMQASDAVIVIIGRHWLTASGEHGRRLDSPDDYLRREVEAALGRASEILLIPVLVDGADMPDPQQLPATLRPLCEYNALRLPPDRGWGAAVDLLVRRLSESRRSSNAEEEEEEEEDPTDPGASPTNAVADHPPRSSDRTTDDPSSAYEAPAEPNAHRSEPSVPVSPVRRSGRPAWNVVVGISGVVIALSFGWFALAHMSGSNDPSASCDKGVRWNQKNSPFVDGALVVTLGGTGAAIVFGHAQFKFGSATEAADLVGNADRYIEISEAELNAIDVRPRDGLLIREQSHDGASPGRLFLALGGAVYQVRNENSLDAIGLHAADASVVSSSGLDGTPRIPATGTLLRIGNTKNIWVIDGGVRRLTTHRCTGAVVNQLPDDPQILDEIAVAPGRATS